MPAESVVKLWSCLGSSIQNCLSRRRPRCQPPSVHVGTQVLCLKTWKHFFRKTLTSFCSSFQACMAHFRHLTFASIAMTLYPPSSMFGVLELEVCWDSDLKISIEDEVIPVHPSVLIAQRSRFLSDLFGPDFTEATATVPVKPPHPELFLRALHSITTRARPELTEVRGWLAFHSSKVRNALHLSLT